MKKHSPCLSIEGYSSIGATNGTEGIEKANEMKPDLIICDVIMPDIDGFQVQANYYQTALQKQFLSYFLHPVLPMNLLKRA